MLSGAAVRCHSFLSLQVWLWFDTLVPPSSMGDATFGMRLSIVIMKIMIYCLSRIGRILSTLLTDYDPFIQKEK